MSRKDFEAIAKACAAVESLQSRTQFVQALLPHLYTTNPRFDAVRFCKACNTPNLI